jgi:hypothetical protein
MPLTEATETEKKATDATKATEATEARQDAEQDEIGVNDEVEMLKNSIAEGQRELAKKIKVAEAASIRTKRTRREEKRLLDPGAEDGAPPAKKPKLDKSATHPRKAHWKRGRGRGRGRRGGHGGRGGGGGNFFFYQYGK